jgi:tetratricopeptide (TPR) repeat protein
VLRALLDRLSATRAKAASHAPPPETAPATPWQAQGNAALATGDLREAARCFEQGVQAQPQAAALRLNLGFVLLRQGQFAAATERLSQALALRVAGDGVEPDALYLLGCAQEGLGRVGEALASFESAVRARPGFTEPMRGALRAAQRLGRGAEAVDWARRLAQAAPSPETRLLLANQLFVAGNAAEALDLLDRVVADQPGHLGAAALRYEALCRLGRFDEALTQAERVLAITGPDARALANVGFVLEKLDRLDEALARIDEALQLDPANKGAILNRVAVLMQLARTREARDAAHQALSAYPDDPNLHWNLGLCHLTLGDFLPGWAEHEWRFRSDAVVETGPGFAQPHWHRESLAGRTLLVYGEQGFGDNIQFLRFLPQVARQARQVLLQLPPALEPLMLDLPSNVRLLRAGELMPDFDFHCPVMSLPAVVGTTLDDLPASAPVPYLRADPAAVRAWRDRLGGDLLNVGIAWSGNPAQGNDRRRSMPLETFRQLAAQGCRFVTLQPDLRDADRASLGRWGELVDAGRELRNFADTAALASAVDLVISVDTGVAHLAGALGRPLWVVLAHVPEQAEHQLQVLHRGAAGALAQVVQARDQHRVA